MVKNEDKLKADGLRKEIGHYGRIFTPRQVNIILSHLE